MKWVHSHSNLFEPVGYRNENPESAGSRGSDTSLVISTATTPLTPSAVTTRLTVRVTLKAG